MGPLSRTWTLTKVRLLLATRNRAFFFFSLVMPVIFLVGAVVFIGRKTQWSGYILGAIVATTVMGSFWGLSVQLVSFREQGILRRFRIAPVGAGPMLASSIISNYFMALPVIFLEILVCRVALHMQNSGNLWAILVLATIGSATFSSLGLIVASVTNTMQETQMINNLIWMGFLFLGGATIPVGSFPRWLQRVSLFIPAQYLATGLQSAATWRATPSEIVEDVVALSVGLLVAFEMSRRLFRWEPEAKARPRAKLWVLAAFVPFLLFGTWENIRGGQLKRVTTNYQVLSRMTTQQMRDH
ncbi:MAG TPA: ABC transporter permease [Verrucomicrobiae bacterium]|nr:ABC transporter permease [Verrucomicrobiae bacterium]